MTLETDRSLPQADTEADTEADTQADTEAEIETAFDIRQIPFSTRGSWLDLSPVVGLHTSRDEVHLVSHVNGIHPVLELRPELDGAPAAVQWRTGPDRHEWRGAGGVVAAAFDEPRTLRLRGTGLQLRLTEAMSRVIRDEDFRLSAGRRAHERARTHDVHSYAKRLADHYQRIAPVAEWRAES